MGSGLGTSPKMFWLADCSNSKDTWNSWLSRIRRFILDIGLLETSIWESPKIRIAQFWFWPKKEYCNSPQKTLQYPLAMAGNAHNIDINKMTDLTIPSWRNIFRETHGDFSAVYWSDSRQELLVGSDFYGLFSSFDTLIRGELVAASDLRLLLCHPDLDWKVDLDSLQWAVGMHASLMECEMPRGKTLFKQIHQLPPSSIFSWSSGIRQEQQYWVAQQDLQTDVVDQPIEAFRHSLISAVETRAAGRKTALEISGGIDSASTLGAILASKSAKSLNAVSVYFKNPLLTQSHDYQTVLSICKHVKIPVSFIAGDNALRTPNLEHEDPITLDGPDPRACALLNYATDRWVFNNDIDVLLTGEGGDGLIEGIPYVVDSLIRRGRWREAWKYALKTGNGTFVSALKEIGLSILALIPIIRNKIYNDELWSDVKQPSPKYLKLSPSKNQFKHLNSASSFLPDMARRHIHDFMWPQARYIDYFPLHSYRTSPFFDKRVIELAFRIPPEQHINFELLKDSFYRSSKMVQRHAFADLLPDTIIKRQTKTNYVASARIQLVNDGPALLRLFDSRRDIALADFGILEPKPFVKRLVSEMIKAQDPQCSLSFEYVLIQQIIDFELWLQNLQLGSEAILKRSGFEFMFKLANLENASNYD